MRARRYGGTIQVYTEVDVDPSDVLEAISDKELMEEVESRKDLKKKIETRAAQLDETDLVEEALNWLRRGDVQEAILILERALYPKFRTLELCEKRFEAARTALLPPHQGGGAA